VQICRNQSGRRRWLSDIAYEYINTIVSAGEECIVPTLDSRPAISIYARRCQMTLCVTINIVKTIGSRPYYNYIEMPEPIMSMRMTVKYRLRIHQYCPISQAMECRTHLGSTSSDFGLCLPLSNNARKDISTAQYREKKQRTPPTPSPPIRYMHKTHTAHTPWHTANRTAGNSNPPNTPPISLADDGPGPTTRQQKRRGHTYLYIPSNKIKNKTGRDNRRKRGGSGPRTERRVHTKLNHPGEPIPSP
jgi:hypothetical protein